MKLKPFFTLAVLSFYSLFCFGQSDGDYTITGHHSKFGDFTGRGWIHNGVAQRLVKFKSYRYENKEVEEVWSGKINEKLSFSLYQSNLLTSFNGYAPSDEAFITPAMASIPSDVFKHQASYEVSGDKIEEHWINTGTHAQIPLWQDLRTSTEALGKTQGFVNFIRQISRINEVIKNYRNHPEILVYKDRPEFITATQYVIRDKTDADFYLKNPNVLRITNKTTNPLSLAEAMMRRNAYGNTLATKERILRDETINLNFNPAGILENAVVDESGAHIGKQTEYDTALWSSMFGWAEFLRYQVTKDPEAIKNYRKVLDAILTLVEITNDPKEFARGLSVSPVEEDLGEGWIQGEGKYAHLKWRKGGNNDMVKGVFITLILAHQVVKADEVELVARIQKNVKALANLSAVADRSFNLGIAEGLDALWNKDEPKLTKFYKKIFNIQNSLGKINDLGTGMYFGGIADWSGIHLTMTSNFAQLLLAKELQKVYSNGKSNKRAVKLEKAAEDKLIGQYEIYKNTIRDYLMLMIWSYVPKFQNDPKIKETIREALWTLKEIPAPRSFGTAKADLKKHAHWTASAWPRQPWKAMDAFRNINEDFDVYRLRQGAYSYPIFEGLAWNITYFWKHLPYEAYWESDARIKTFSSDYLLIYWATRASGLTSSED